MNVVCSLPPDFTSLIIHSKFSFFLKHVAGQRKVLTEINKCKLSLALKTRVSLRALKPTDCVVCAAFSCKVPYACVFPLNNFGFSSCVNGRRKGMTREREEKRSDHE